MLNLLVPLIPLLPLVGFAVLAVTGARLPRKTVAAVGVGSVGLSAILAVIVAAAFAGLSPENGARDVVLWRWIDVGSFTPEVSFHLDSLAVVMLLVITVVAFLIHLYSAEYMEEDDGYGRFFAYMNLFVGSMLILVLAADLLVLLLGWEGVGLSSYLLIGFWYREEKNGRAARKAFIVTRIGDAALLVGLFVLYEATGTLNVSEVLAAAPGLGAGTALAAALLLLAGAVGKSAQLPLQTWLPDAMAGPTPVSALIHAATMVTAGVYLIARMHTLFMASPAAMAVVAGIGALTLVLAAFAALAQEDIKRVLAYSTMSQIGYMFLALGVGAWTAAIFHFATHAFFKALLFLAAGCVIRALHEEHSVLRMGGLRRPLPVVFWTFLIGAASLAALPLVTAGFYSKDLILWRAWSSPNGGAWLWGAGVLGAFLTAVYTFRVVFLVFFGPLSRPVGRSPGARIAVPLVALAVLSIVGGFMEMPSGLGSVHFLGAFLGSTFGEAPVAETSGEFALGLIVSCLTLLGIALAWALFVRWRPLVEKALATRAGGLARRLFHSGWGFDQLYDLLLVQPFLWVSRANRADFVDAVFRGVALMCQIGHRLLSESQTGRLRWYATLIAGGAAIALALVVLS